MPDQTTIHHVPVQTVRRLPAYRRMVLAHKAEGGRVISCTKIAAELGLQPIQVRKDIACTGIVGKPRVGYAVEELLEAIETFLGWRNASDAFLVGVGNLGSAILGYGGFRERGLNLVAAFDNDPARIGTTVHGVQVLPIEHLADLAFRMHVKIGVLTVGREAAQDAAALMVASGIEAIWNFAPIRLEVPDFIIVEDVDLAASLAVLSSKLASRLANTH